jgi:hypothetical protein
MDRDFHDRVITAIQSKRLIRYETLDQEPRVAEPYVYGAQGGVPTLLVYHVDGPETERWQELPLPDLLELEVLDQTFAGKRPLPPELDPDRQEMKPINPD